MDRSSHSGLFLSVCFLFLVSACVNTETQFSQDYQRAFSQGTVGAYEEFLAKYAASVEGKTPFYLYQLAYLKLFRLKAKNAGQSGKTGYDAILNRFSRKKIDRSPSYTQTDITSPGIFDPAGEKPGTAPRSTVSKIPPIKALPLIPVQQKELERLK